MLVRKETNIHYNKWDDLMRSCVDVFDERWARDFFDDVETMARDLGLTLADGRRFSADDAMEDWRFVEDKVNKWIEDENLDVDDGLPNVGLVYRLYDDKLVLGIHDGVGGFDEMAAWKFIKKDKTQEGVVFGDADKGIADNIEIVIRNDYRLYKQMEAFVNSLVKKASRGIELDKEKLMNSSVVDQLVRDTIRQLQREDHEGDNEGLFDHISTATRKLAKQFVAETILDKVEDTIRFNNK